MVQKWSHNLPHPPHHRVLQVVEMKFTTDILIYCEKELISENAILAN